MVHDGTGHHPGNRTNWRRTRPGCPAVRGVPPEPGSRARHMSAVRWGVLTTARIAQDRFLPAMQKARNAVASAISSPSGRAAEVASRFSIPTVYESHEELLADPTIEAVYLPFPNGLHAEWI